MVMENIVEDIAAQAFNEWLAQVDNPDAEKLTSITQRHFDKAYQAEVLQFAVTVRKVNTPCGLTFLDVFKGEEVLFSSSIHFECGKKDCPHAATCGSGEPKCAVNKLMEMV